MKVATRQARLSDIALLNPTLGARLLPSESISFVPMAAVSAETARVGAVADRPYSEVSKGYTPFLSGDVLIAKITPCFENGKIAQALLPRKHGFGSTEFHVVRPHGDKADARYLLHYLRLGRIRTEGERRMTGSGGQRRVPADFLAQLEVPLPPLSEQRRIAAILDQAETLRSQRRAGLAQFDSLVRSVFVEMFGDPLTNPKGFPCARLGTLCELVRGSSPRPQGDPRFFGGPVPRLMVADITRDGWLVTPKIDSLTVEGARSSRPIDAGTVVMAVSGNVGLVSKLAINACVHDGFVALKKLDTKRVLPEFVLALLHFSKSVHDRAQAGAIFQNLTTTDIKAMNLMIPDLLLQQTFAARIYAIEALKATHRAALAELDALFASLQHRAFQGQL